MFRTLFGFLFSLVKKAFQAAQENGLTDEIVTRALALAREAVTKFDDDAERREWVVTSLTANRVPESIARFALEAAVQLLKQELAKR